MLWYESVLAPKAQIINRRFKSCAKGAIHAEGKSSPENELPLRGMIWLRHDLPQGGSGEGFISRTVT
ncbi:MAG: hypothetical protein ILO42_04685 [Clostridia bacterium]|nr:hypothetical protein [Clostridia bacterium]